MRSIIRSSMFAPVLLAATIGMAAYGQGIITTGKSANQGNRLQASNTVNTVKTTISDSAITADVKAKLLANPGTKGFDIHVETNHGVVTLHGTVRSTAEKELAERLAMSADGVKAVDNDLTVKKSKGSK
ncbi:MAG TPA: BON domain-containing protein [Gammaproteobacteria bacterium]|nr:BON domain-containing protein [Gammaproteobacteria bacterium]